jgi:hypothetical protein
MTDVKYESYALPRWANPEGTAIHCQLLGVEVKGTKFGELPFLATNYDVADHGKEIFELIKANQDKVPIEAFITRPAPPPLTTQELAKQAFLGTTVIVECASLPVLNGTYKITLPFQAEITAIVSLLNAGHDFPSGTDVLDYHDSEGVTHPWPETQFLLFAKGVTKYIYDLKHTAEATSAVLPSNVITIP